MLEKQTAQELLSDIEMPGLPDKIECYYERGQIAQAIRDLRTELGLSQSELAKQAGTQQSAIARMENLDYEGHSLAAVNRIAEACGYRISLTLHRV